MFVVAFSGILADILSGIQVSHYACDEISMFSCMVLGGWEGGGGESGNKGLTYFLGQDGMVTNLPEGQNYRKSNLPKIWDHGKSSLPKA